MSSVVDHEESKMPHDDVPEPASPDAPDPASAGAEPQIGHESGQATSYPWPAPDQHTQVLDPDTHSTTVYPSQYQGYQGYAGPESAPADPWPAPGSDGYLPPPPGVTPQTTVPAGKSGGVGKIIAIAALTGLLAGVGGGALGYQLAQGSRSSSSVTVNAPSNPDALSPRADGSIASIADEVLPSVVSLEVSGGGQAGSGSGFVVSADGYILTNNHVIEAAVDGGSIGVVLQDGTRLTGELVGRNADYDLAVVKVDRTGLTPVQIGDSNSVQVGDQAIAIGSPLGLEGTVTSGIVSALDRPVTAGGAGGGETSFINAIQTDAPINPGNSGGPLVNAEGQVIGVNSAIASLGTDSGGQAGSIGLGFAIPINTANRIAQEIIRTGTSATPIIGAEIDFNFSGQGARVQSVTPGGPAEKAGLRSGDVIVSVNGQRVDDAVSLITDIRQNAPGDQITLTLDNGKEIQVTLGQR
ncbi:MAG TPA: trypsin-like peptidase domain-containing protein [Actinomycetota bacterium]|nr:trypsin-like peptidase domain-containing protein [Actinomycetota bacterium]